MSATTDARPLDLDAIAARRKAAWLDGDDKANRELIANDVPDMLLHLREAQGRADGTVEYATALDVAAMNQLAGQGWRLHTPLFCGTNIVYVMVRGGDSDLREQRDAERRRADRFAEELRGARTQLAGWGELVDAARVQADAERAELAAERDRLAEMTPGELLQVRRADSDGGQS